MPEAEIAARVLIVDDDPTMRLLTAATLEAAGFEVIEASDGDAGLRCFAEQQPDLVLLDVEMPGIDGFEVCRRLRQVADAALLPIVMVTGRDDLASISLAYEAGATDFLAKPINWPMLGHRVRYVLRGALTLRALDAAQARNAAMLQAIPDHLLTLAGDGRVPALQGPPHEPAGPRIDDLLPPAAAGLMKDALQRAMQGGETAVLTTSFPCVTLPAQANMLTGKLPDEHGVVANGFYWRESRQVPVDQTLRALRLAGAWNHELHAGGGRRGGARARAQKAAPGHSGFENAISHWDLLG